MMSPENLMCPDCLKMACECTPDNYDPCKDHEWVSMKNEHIESGEMCLTCYQSGATRVPVRREVL